MSGEPSIPRSVLLEIYAQARAEFPSECCGFLYGVGADTELVRCTNRQDQLHELDPELYTRTSENAYSIGGKELLELTRSFGTDRPVTVIYHSHPRVGAYFSEEDTSAALVASHPVGYLVVDVQDDEIGEAKLFVREGRTFVEVERFEGAKL